MDFCTSQKAHNHIVALEPFHFEAECLKQHMQFAVFILLNK